MDNLQKYSQLIAVIIGVAAPCMLLAGYSYHLGHIDGFGLDSSLLNRGFGDVITESWYVGVLLLIFFLKKWLWMLIYFCVMLTILLGAFFYFVRRKVRGVDVFANPITKENQGRSIFGFTQWHWKCCGELVIEVGTMFFIPLVVLLAAVTVAILPFLKGNEYAHETIENFRKHGCEINPEKTHNFSRCVYLIDISSSNATTVAQGVLVTANNERVAIFTANAIEVWPLLDNYKLQKAYLPKEIK
jgi:lysylphosphatidylglycerol synthetase-like protein (DUF2156 family)